MDFYVRVFVRVYTSAKEVKNSARRLSYLYQSQGCSSFHLQPLGQAVETGKGGVKYSPGQGPVVPQKCPETGSRYLVGGPLWNGPLHDQEFVGRVLEEVSGSGGGRYPAKERIAAVLTNVAEELPDAPLYFDQHEVCKVLRTTAPKAETLRSAIANAGYRVSGTHASPLGLKTDCPWDVLWDIMRCWHKEALKTTNIRPPEPGSYQEKMLSKEPVHQANFARNAEALSKAKGEGKGRFLPNPEENWGPQRRHGSKAPLPGHAVEKFAKKRTAAEGGDEAGGDEAGGGGKKAKQ